MRQGKTLIRLGVWSDSDAGKTRQKGGQKAKAEGAKIERAGNWLPGALAAQEEKETA